MKQGPALLAAGNNIIFKPAPSLYNCSKAVQELFTEAGFTQGEVGTLNTDDRSSAEVIADYRIRGVNFTGSAQGGSAVAAVSSKHLKKCSMELGGSDPFIVCEDADIDHAASEMALTRMTNAGQICISGKRAIINEKVYDEFKEKLMQKIEALSFGDPSDPKTVCGPIHREDLRDKLMMQVMSTQEEGAKVTQLKANQKFEGEYEGGFWFKPVLVEGMQRTMKCYQEEFFGPVFQLFKAKNDEHAIETANDTPYGLGSAVFSQDLERAEGIADRLEAGGTYINELMKVSAELPSGGIKNSGFGRECAEHGLKQFTNQKALNVRKL